MKVVKRTRFGVEDVLFAREFAPTEVGEIALKIATHFAVIAARPDGEDTEGRQKLALLEPDEVAKRSCDVAEAIWKELTDRKLLINVPLP